MQHGAPTNFVIETAGEAYLSKQKFNDRANGRDLNRTTAQGFERDCTDLHVQPWVFKSRRLAPRAAQTSRHVINRTHNGAGV